MLDQLPWADLFAIAGEEVEGPPSDIIAVLLAIPLVGEEIGGLVSRGSRDSVWVSDIKDLGEV